MISSLKRIKALTKRNLIEMTRDPVSIVFAIGLPLVLEVMFYLIFHDLTEQFEMRSLAPSIVVFSQAFLCLFVGILISTDRTTSFLTRLYVSGARSFEFIISYALSVLPIAAVQSVLFILVGGAIDSSLFTLGAVYAILLSLFTALFFIGAGILFGSICNERSIGGVASIIIMGQSVLSGMWFPPEGLGDTVVFVMKVLPFKNAADIIGNLINGAACGFDNFFLPLIVVLCYTIAAFAAAIFAFAGKMRAK